MNSERLRVLWDTPCDFLALHAANPSYFPGLLESVAKGSATGRYDILFAAPGERLVLDASGLSGPHADAERSFLAALDAWAQSERTQAPADDLPFHGGWLLFLAYELLSECEPRVPVSTDPAELPIACAQRCRGAVIREHASGRTWLVADDAQSLAAIEQQLGRHQRTQALPDLPVVAEAHVESTDRLRTSLRRIHEYVLAGDVFQVNLSRGWSAKYSSTLDPSTVYCRLRNSNPGPFAGLFRQDDWAVISSSPERLVKVDDGWIESRPIAGTRRRDRDLGRDDDLQAELLAHPKERAEHVMLIDLERNDLGRLCLPGTVEVDDLMVLESYAHVHHIVSNVRGRLRGDVSAGQAIAATFPGGTITGCPKVRCMEIIQELEPAGRGAYTGAMGYLGTDGRMDLNILIRTIVTRGASAWFRAGAGIVADSDEDAEIHEMQAKARGLLPALGLDPELGLS